MNKRIAVFCCLIVTLSLANAQLRVKAVGDIMMGSITPSPVLPPSNGAVFVDSIAHHLDSADITFGNLEGVFINGDVKPQKCSEASRKAHRCYEFGMPDTLAYTLEKLNYSVLSMDNNHNSDYGWQGVSNTKKKLDEVGIAYAAKKSPVVLRVPKEFKTISFRVDSVLKDSVWVLDTAVVESFSIDTIEVAVVAFGHSSISYHVADLKNTQEVVAELSAKYEIVIVSFHGGAEGTSAQHVKDQNEEYYGEARGNVLRFAHTAIDAGADLVIGHGPHVLRALELYKDRLICYSLGNFLTYGNVNIREIKGLGAIMDVKLDLTDGHFQSGSIIPTRQGGRGIPALDQKAEAIAVISMLTKSDFPEGNIEISAEGQILKKEEVK